MSEKKTETVEVEVTVVVTVEVPVVAGAAENGADYLNRFGAELDLVKPVPGVTEVSSVGWEERWRESDDRR